MMQVRDPLRTVASLLAKAGDNCSNAEHQLAVIQSLFPEVSE
jgi:hypothetical protein